MRIYDLDKNFDKLIEDGGFQIELIGENKSWSVTVSKREWSNEKQRHVYEWMGGCTTPSILTAYDFVAQIISGDAICSQGHEKIT